MDISVSKKIAEAVINKALSKGGDFAEIFCENTVRNNISMVNGHVDKTVSGLDYGAGIRVVNGTNAVYVYTNDMSENGLIKTAKAAADAIGETQRANCKQYQVIEYNNRNNIKILPSEVKNKEKRNLLKEASDTAFQYSNKITQTRSGYMDSTQNILIVNSDGLWAEDRRIRSRFSIETVAGNGSEKQSGRLSPGGSEGFELFNRIDVREISREAAKTAVTMLDAKECPSGKMTVVIDNGFGGVIFHEACGHSLEATAVAKNASVFAGKLGEKIASDVVTAIDDGTIPNGWGSANIDDEGTLTQKNILIENGVLKSYMIDMLNGRKMGMKSTGSSRRESYKYAPTSRMTNTFIAAGKSTTKEIIENTEFGLYAKQMGGGSVEPATGVFNFAVLEGYIIRNGKICEPVRGATLIGKGSEILVNIDMVGNNLMRAQGMCGSISGSIPADVGQPMIRVQNMTVGGRGL
ncbi:MAG: TldD/PmbA family protein [Candidatus Metalachnospira sp.]|nr:TldD/PmbA family protein [Candidatus Metalachnospira sp.]